jgi:hypothetical protein
VVLLLAYISVLFHLAGKGNSAVLGPVPAPPPVAGAAE